AVGVNSEHEGSRRLVLRVLFEELLGLVYTLFIFGPLEAGSNIPRSPRNSSPAKNVLRPGDKCDKPSRLRRVTLTVSNTRIYELSCPWRQINTPSRNRSIECCRTISSFAIHCPIGHGV